MTTIVIRPKSKDEKIFLSRLLKKMNVEAEIVEEPTPNYETQLAMRDVENKVGARVKDSQDLFNQLGI